MDETPSLRILRLPDVLAVTGLARSTVYDRIARGEFPSPVNLGDRAVGWIEAEILAWIRQRIAASRPGGLARSPRASARCDGEGVA